MLSGQVQYQGKTGFFKFDFQNQFTWPFCCTVKQLINTKKDKIAVKNDVKNWAYVSLK